MAEEYKSVHTGPDIDAAVTRALPGGGIDQAMNAKPNPNLLDNWYFGNPVDQRGGLVVPPGEGYYIPGTGTQVGTTSTYYPVLRMTDGQYPTINVGGTEYVTPPDTAVRGYTGAGYNIDRWRNYQGMLIFENDYSITFVASAQYQRLNQTFESYVLQVGEKYTATFLLADGTLKTSTFTYSAAANQWIDNLPNGFYLEIVHSASDGTAMVNIVNGADGQRSISLKAVKLEIGTEQTLAHQENGKWVLNEIPNYGQELAKCQRYYEKSCDMSVVAGSVNNSSVEERLVKDSWTFYERNVRYKVSKRAKAAVTFYSAGTGAIGMAHESEAGADYAIMTAYNSENGFVVRHVNSDLPSGKPLRFYWVADADL